MSLFYAVRRTAFSVAPAAFRALKQQRFIHSTLGSAFQSRCRKEVVNGTPWFPSRAATSIAAYSKSNKNLLELLEDEIECELESDPLTEDTKPPGTWEMEDILGDQAVILRMKYGNEDIKVEVMAGDMGDNDEDDNEEKDSDGNIIFVKTHVNLTVSISKGEGPWLEFICTGYAIGVSIDAMNIEHPHKKPSDEGDRIPYEGPDFNDLDENLQEAFHKYLEVRGIKDSLSTYLIDYMINKKRKEYINWLKTVKEYVEK